MSGLPDRTVPLFVGELGGSCSGSNICSEAVEGELDTVLDQTTVVTRRWGVGDLDLPVGPDCLLDLRFFLTPTILSNSASYPAHIKRDQAQEIYMERPVVT